jgi:hypothetical protein
MGRCKTPGCSEKYYTKMPCRVHQLLDGDSSPRLVAYCDDCKAYICQDCMGNIARRTAAFAMTVADIFKEAAIDSLESISNVFKKKKSENKDVDEIIDTDKEDIA